MPSYFEEHGSKLSLPYGRTGASGFRRGQYGALHAISSHFTLSSEPFLAVLPTGLGKTAVLASIPFLLRARRVLVVAPSRLVREQIATEFRMLQQLQKVGALTEKPKGMKVHEVEGVLSTVSEWEKLAAFDVVIGLPNSMSPHYTGVAYPPNDLFDLVLVDEAHHEQAPTWRVLLDHFEEAKRVLVTATPYRRDEKRIRYKGSYIFPMSEALRDGVYAPVDFLPIEPVLNQNSDVAIATEVAAMFQRDKSNGMAHRVLVRTDRIGRGRELLKLYEQNTPLKLELLTSEGTLQTAFDQLRRVKEGSLDGVIAVNMIGEGLDLPNLKIAALHNPQRSLEATLQFIGRLSRVGGKDLGRATVIAVPEDLQGELGALYDTGAVWTTLIPKLADARLIRHEAEREVLQSFQRPAIVTSLTQDLPLEALEPRFHCKVFRTFESLTLHNGLVRRLGDIEFNTASLAEDTLIWIGASARRPPWLGTNHLVNVNYHLYVVRYHKKSKLLFVCCSTDSQYSHDDIAEFLCRTPPEPVPLRTIERVLLDVQDIECFQFGMRSNFAGAVGDAYKINAGPRADVSVSPLDGVTHHKGHAVVKGKDNGAVITVGYSSGKVWSLQRGDIARLLLWLDAIGEKLVRNEQVRTYTAMDYLSSGELISKFPENPLYVAHNPVAYREFPLIIDSSTGEGVRFDETECKVCYDGCSPTAVPFELVMSNSSKVTCTLHLDAPFVRDDQGESAGYLVSYRNDEYGLMDFLNEHLPSLHFPDLSVITGNSLVRGPVQGIGLFPNSGFQCQEWCTSCDITIEEGPNSVHEAVEAMLIRHGPQDLIYYDHETGELADFIAISEGDQSVNVSLYHCKALKVNRRRGRPAPRGQITDIYEIDGQGTKCALALSTVGDVVAHIGRRYRTVANAKFCQGSIGDLTGLAERARRKQATFNIILVHPGLSLARVSTSIRDVFGCLDELCRKKLHTSLRVLCSP